MAYREWMKAYTRIDEQTGEMQIRYSHTPEQYVAELIARDEYMWVAKGSCHECYYTPERSIPLAHKETMEKWTTTAHIFPECICGSIAAHFRREDVPEVLYCYAHFYQYWQVNPYIAAAKEAGRVKFFDTSGLPGLRESGMKWWGFSVPTSKAKPPTMP